MADTLTDIVNELIPLIRQFGRGDYGIALGGAHAKGMDDAESDIDLYFFTRQPLPGDDRNRLCQQFSSAIESIVSWGETLDFEQAGTDFLYGQRKIECWLRGIDYIDGIIAECKHGIVKHDLVTWTVMGFYNHCALSDLNKMVPVDDPVGLLARWKAGVGVYPLLLRKAIIDRHLAAAKFWPDNFHYKSAIERCDLIYTMGIVQRVIHNLIQVVFAVNETYFPGDKKLDLAINHLARIPDHFAERIKQLIFPGTRPSKALLREQRAQLLGLLKEVDSIASHSS